MPPTSPYQPWLLRMLHGAMVLLVPLAWLSGAVVFSNHDGRWLRLPIQVPGDWIDIHGTIGVLLWPLAALFVIYSLSVGRFRLRHGANTAALIGLVLAVVSGKFMQEDWLRNGELINVIYDLHVMAWLLVAVTVSWHIQAVITRGGLALASSMFKLKVRTNDKLLR